MSAGYLPPVVVSITGDIRDLLAAIGDAQLALADFAKGTYDATLTATWGAVTASITAAEGALKQFQTNTYDATLGASAKDLAADMAAATKVLDAWSKLHEDAHLGAEFAALPAELAAAKRLLNAWGDDKDAVKLQLSWGLPLRPPPDWHNEPWVKGWEEIKLHWAMPTAPPPEWKGKPWVIPVDPELAAAEVIKVDAQLAAFAKQLKGMPLTANTEPLLAEAEAARQKIQGWATDLMVGADTAPALADVKALEAWIAKQTVDLNVGAIAFGGSGDAAGKSWIAGFLGAVSGGAAAGGGGGLGAALGFGTGKIPFLAGLGAFGTIAAILGFGSEHALLTAAGLVGSAVMGAIGGGILATAGAGVLGTGILTDLAGIGQAAGDIKNVVTVLNQYQTLTQALNQTLPKTAAAQNALNAALNSFAPVARPAVLQASLLAQQLHAMFDFATGTAEARGANIITDFLNALKPFIGPIGTDAARNMTIIQKALQPFFQWLDSVKAGGGFQIFTELENIFTSHLSAGVTAVINAIELLAKTIGAVAPQTGGFFSGIEKFLAQANTSKGFAQWMSEVNKMISQFHTWMGLLSAVFHTVTDLFSPAVGAGQALVKLLTQLINQMDAWAKSTQGKGDLSNLFNAHFNELIKGLGGLLKAVMPDLLQFVGSFSKLLVVGADMTTDVLQPLTQIINEINKHPVASQVLAWAAAFVVLGRAIKNLDLANLSTLGKLGGYAGGVLLLSDAMSKLSVFKDIHFNVEQWELDFTNSMQKFGANIGPTVTRWGVNVGNWLAGGFEKSINGMISWLKKAIDGIPALFEGIPSAVMHAVNGLVGDFKNLGDSMASALVRAFSSVGADIVNLILSGLKASWGELGKLGGAVGGLLGLAEGGLVTRPTLAVVGEAGPELIVPLANLGLGGASLPGVGALGGIPYGSAGGTGTGITVQSYNNINIANSGGLLLQPGTTLRREIDRLFEQHDRELLRVLRAGTSR